MGKDLLRSFIASHKCSRKQYADFLRSLVPDSDCYNITDHIRNELFGFNDESVDGEYFDDFTIDDNDPKSSAFYKQVEKVVLDACRCRDITISRAAEVLAMPIGKIREIVNW